MDTLSFVDILLVRSPILVKFPSSFCFYFSQIRTVKVSNISLVTSKMEIQEFFSFSGDIRYIEMQR